MKRRGFTLVEVMIVVSIIALLTIPLLTLADMIYASNNLWLARCDQSADAARAAAIVFREAEMSRGARPGADNHSLDLSGRGRVTWSGDTLALETPTGRRVLASGVRDFTVIRQGRLLTLNLELESGRRHPIRSHFTFDRELKS